MPDYSDRGHGTALPRSVIVRFPARLRLGIGCGAPSRYEVEVTLAEAVTPDGQTPGTGDVYASHPGHKRLRSQAPAIFDDPDAAAPANADELAALALAAARDYYAWRLVRADLSFPGTVDYTPGGDADAVRWVYRPDECETRVTPTPFDAEPEDLMHGLPCEEESSSGDPSSSGGCGGARAPDEDYADSFAWVWFPEGGIPASTREGRRVTPASAECEVMVEGDGGALCPSGHFRTVWNYWYRAVPGDRLGTAECWRGRLVAKSAECRQ